MASYPHWELAFIFELSIIIIRGQSHEALVPLVCELLLLGTWVVDGCQGVLALASPVQPCAAPASLESDRRLQPKCRQVSRVGVLFGVAPLVFKAHVGSRCSQRQSCLPPRTLTWLETGTL